MTIDVNVRISSQSIPSDDSELASMVGDDGVRFIYLTDGVWTLTPQSRASSLTIECENGAIINGSTTADVLIQLSGSVQDIRIIGGTWQNAQSIVAHTGTSAMVNCEFRGLSVTNVSAPFLCSASVGCKWIDCTFTGVSTVHCIHFSGSGQSNTNQIVRCRNVGTFGRLVRMSTSDVCAHNHIQDCWSEGNLNGGGLLEVVSNALSVRVTNCYTENNDGHDYIVSPASGRSVSGFSIRDSYFAQDGDLSRVYLSGACHVDAACNVINLDDGVEFIEIATDNVYTCHLFENHLNAIGGGDYAARLFTKSGTQNVVYSTQVSGSVTGDSPSLVTPGSIYGAAVEGNSPLRPHQFGAVGDGVTDDTDAIRALFSAIPGSDNTWSGGFHAALSCVVEFDSRKKYVTDTITIPDYRSVTVKSSATYGALLISRDGNRIFAVNTLVSSNIANVIFEDLAFLGGGIHFQGGTSETGTTHQSQQGHHMIRRCRFHETTLPAIEVGLRVVGGTIEQCWFDKCSTSVSFTKKDSDVWLVMKCAFVRCRGDSLVINSTSVLVFNNAFEQREDAYVDSSFIRVGIGRDVVISHNRFGNEPQPPRSCITLERVDPSINLYGVRITNNIFNGAGSLSSNPLHAEYAIRILSPPQLFMISHNRFFYYRVATVGEDWFSVDANGAASSRLSFFRDNMMQDGPQETMPYDVIFERGGMCFLGITDEILEPNQTLNQSVTAWTKSNCTVSDEGDGEFVLTRVADPGSSYVLSPTPSAPNLPGTAVVWVKSEGSTTTTITLLDTSNRYVAPLQAPIIVTDRWKKIEIPINALNDGRPARMLIYVGLPGLAGVAGDAIRVRAPSIFETGV